MPAILDIETLTLSSSDNGASRRKTYRYEQRHPATTTRKGSGAWGFRGGSLGCFWTHKELYEEVRHTVANEWQRENNWPYIAQQLVAELERLA